MRIKVYGKAHLEGVAKKSGNPYSFNQVHYLGKARGVEGQAALTLALDSFDYAFCKRFPDELTSEIFEHILNKALNNRMLDTSAIFIDGTHIKASANKKKYRKEQVAKAAKIYSRQLRREVNAEREKLGKKPIEDDDDENQGVEAHRKPQKRPFPPQTRTAECSKMESMNGNLPTKRIRLVTEEGLFWE